MPTLFHMPGSTCSQKVRIALAEKGVEWQGEIVIGPGLRTPEYLALNPGGYVPTLIHQSRTIRESRIISEYVNAAFDGPSLLPQRPAELAEAAYWTRMIDDRVHGYVSSFSIVARFRAMLLAMPAEARARSAPRDPMRREILADILERATDSRYVAIARDGIVAWLRELDEALRSRHWIAGATYSLADADATPYLERLSALALDDLWAGHPHVSRWHESVRARPSFRTAVEAWRTDAEKAGGAEAALHARALLQPVLSVLTVS